MKRSRFSDEQIEDEIGLSERRSCRIVGLHRSVQQYRMEPSNDQVVIERMEALASENRR